MAREVDITPLMEATSTPHEGSILVSGNMSGVEADPKDDWLYLGILAIRELLERDLGTETMGIIGSGNGVDVIASLIAKPGLVRMQITDLLEAHLPKVRENIERNIVNPSTELIFLAGRDAEPLKEPVDLMYANLPLIMVDAENFGRDRATTTVTDAASYMHLSEGKDDPLLKYSMLSQLGLLLSAKEKLNPGSPLITLIGGRIPYEVILETFKRAGMQCRQMYCSFMRQSDPEFMEDYANYEQASGVEFAFFDYSAAATHIKQNFGLDMPDIIEGEDGDWLKAELNDFRLNAQEAWAYAKQGWPVGHLAFAFEVWEGGDTRSD